MASATRGEKLNVETPFGPPSGPLVRAHWEGVDLVFLSRHGDGHLLPPTAVPFRANIWALKSLGVSRVFSVSAVGSMKEEISLGVPVLVDQFIDRTHLRPSTFFGDGVVGHVSMADPVCPSMRALLAARAGVLGLGLRDGGTYVCMEGPQFSSRAESNMYRGVGVDVIGMTNATEAKLAREAGLCYVTIALPTDYDCWHEHHDDVSVGSVMETLATATSTARRLIRDTLDHLDALAPCGCRHAARGAVMTAPDRIPPEAVARLKPILGDAIG
jgi:5'-methylthioadenosine phosphorylase